VIDIYDGAEWTDMDLEDIEGELKCGRSIAEAAQFLCRADSVDEVRRKAQELKLKVRAKAGSKPPR
jgi:hypothetical protein